jgi:hypothetical protein
MRPPPGGLRCRPNDLRGRMAEDSRWCLLLLIRLATTPPASLPKEKPVDIWDGSTLLASLTWAREVLLPGAWLLNRHGPSIT